GDAVWGAANAPNAVHKFATGKNNAGVEFRRRLTAAGAKMMGGEEKSKKGITGAGIKQGDENLTAATAATKDEGIGSRFSQEKSDFSSKISQVEKKMQDMVTGRTPVHEKLKAVGGAVGGVAYGTANSAARMGAGAAMLPFALATMSNDLDSQAWGG